MRATVSFKDMPDGAEVVIEYEDGHTVRISAGPDSPIVRMHLDLVPDGEKA